MTIQAGLAMAYLFSLTAVRLEGVGVVEARPGLGGQCLWRGWSRDLWVERMEAGPTSGACLGYLGGG